MVIDMEDTKLFRQFLNVVFFLLFLLLFIVGIGINGYLENRTNKEESWELLSKCKIMHDNGKDEVINLPKFIENNDKLILKIDISKYKNKPNACISMFLSYCEVNVYADGKIIYSRNIPDDALIPSGASAAILIELPENIKSNYMIMQIDLKLSSVKYTRIPEIHIGNKSDLIISRFTSEFFLIVTSLILIFVFIVMSVWNLYRNLKFKIYEYNMIYISMVGIIVSIYFLTQLWTTYYLFDFAYEAIYFLEYTALSFVAIPALVVANINLTKKMKKINNLLMVVFIFNISIQYIVVLLRISEFRNFLFVDHALLATTSIFLIITYFSTDESTYKNKRKVTNFIFIVSISFLVPSLYYLIYTNVLLYKLVIILILVAVGGEINKVFNHYRRIEKESVKNKFFEEMALKDALTDMPNRRSYDRFENEIKEKNISGWVISIDLNDLKYVNDTYGHNVGDDMIIYFSDIIKKEVLVNPYLTMFRMGGDEFLVFWQATRKLDLNEWVNKMKFEFKSFSNSFIDFQATVSIGYEYYDSDKNINFIDVCKEADKKMYDDKSKYKINSRWRTKYE